MSVLFFTENYGKINAIAYGVRSANKKEKISLNPISYVWLELKKTNDNYVINNYTMERSFNKIYSNFDKLEIAFYLLYTLSKVLSYGVSEESLYKRVENALIYLDELDNIYLKDVDFKYKFLISYLKKLIYEIGIYDNNLNLDNLNLAKELKKLEEYINNYLNIDIDYNKIMLGVDLK